MLRSFFKSGRHAVIVGVLLCANTVHAQTWYGTAFAIGDGYTYVTNEHVIDGAKTICFLSANDKGGKARVLSQDKADDLAILRGNLNLPPLNLSSSLKIEKGMKIYTVGYPVPTIMGLEAKVTEGIVNSLTGVRGDRRRFQVSAAIQPGNSGGPLFDESGNVLGIVVSGLGKRFTEATGYVANTVGYGIHVARLNALIETTQPLPKYVTNTPLRNVNSLAKLVAQLEKSVVLVIASSESRTCESDFDFPIPDFGAVAKTRDQLQRERDDATRIARARAQIEAEQREKERVVARSAQIAKDNEARVLRENLRSSIKVALTKVHPNWESIENSRGFQFYKNSVTGVRGPSLIDLQSPDEAQSIFRRYIFWVLPDFKGGVLSEADQNKLLTGNLNGLGHVSLVNSRLGFFVADFSDSKEVPKEVVIELKNSESWIASKIEKVEGFKASYSFDPSTGVPELGALVFGRSSKD